jgi:opacity protein-like surface antigen
MTKCIVLFLFLILPFASLKAESQGSEYKGITDPFQDPQSYEFAEDEKDDKEFFHLGRFMMLGVDLGLGTYTGGLGRSNSPGFNLGGRLIYFFDKSMALEAGVHFTRTTDNVQPSSNQTIKIETTLIPITAALRYYFDTKNAPKAIAVANPYLVGGGGMYIRNQNVVAQNPVVLDDDASSNNFGALFGAGFEFAIYRRHIYMGADFRYHMVFFGDEDQDFGGILEPGERGGDFFSSLLTITYNF